MPHHLHSHLAIFVIDACVFSTYNSRNYAVLVTTKHFKLLTNWSAKWRVAVKVNKTMSIQFSCLRQESRDKYKIALNNTDLPFP